MQVCVWSAQSSHTWKPPWGLHFHYCCHLGRLQLVFPKDLHKKKKIGCSFCGNPGQSGYLYQLQELLEKVLRLENHPLNQGVDPSHLLKTFLQQHCRLQWLHCMEHFSGTSPEQHPITFLLCWVFHRSRHLLWGWVSETNWPGFLWRLHRPELLHGDQLEEAWNLMSLFQETMAEKVLSQWKSPENT